jgi:type VI secretion system protein ImpA
MSVIDVGKLLQEVSPEAPSGPNLEYDAAYAEVDRLSQGKPERQMGDNVIPAEEPPWREIRTKVIELLSRTKDLRLGILLTKALVRSDGLAGLNDGLEVLHSFIDRYWETIHPQLDPEDGNDPTLRVNTVAALCHADAMLRMVREAPLVVARSGRFSMRDVLIATGRIASASGTPSPEAAAVEGAFMDCEVEALQATTDQVTAAIGHMKGIEASLTEKVGVTHAADLSELTSLLATAQRVLGERLAARGVAVEGLEAVPGAAVAGAAGGRQPITGEVGSREDAIRMLDKVCDYFSRNEPSSPVPILLRRAKKLVSKSFMEIVKDLAPDGLSQVEKIRGSEE